MKIAHVLWALETGGVETMLVDIVNEQIKTDEVLIVAINDLVNYKLCSKIDKRCKVKLLNRKIGSKNPIPWIKLNVTLFKYKPDIIHCHLEGFRKMILYPAPTVATIHNTHTSTSEYSRFKALYAISEAVRHFTENQGYVAKTIYNGIHPELIGVKDTSFNERIKIICVGRLYFPHKGQDILANAVKILVDSGTANFSVDFIGEGPSRRELELFIQDNKLRDYIHILGLKDRNFIYTHLKEYDLFIQPSRSEGFGLTLCEAMAAGVPVITSDIEGPMEVIGHGKYGKYFETGNIDDLVRVLSETIGNYKNIDTKSPRDYVIENFDVKKTAQKYLEEYQRIIV